MDLVPGIYRLRGPAGAEVTFQLPMPGLSLERAAEQIEAGELEVIEAPKPPKAGRRSSA